MSEPKKRAYRDRKAEARLYYIKNREKKLKQQREYLKNITPEKKEKRKQDKLKYRKTANGIKKTRIHNWKYSGIISDDWDKTYDRVINSTNCEYCDKIYIRDKFRHLDHDHSILDKHNIRGVLCKNCNVRDVFGKL